DYSLNYLLAKSYLYEKNYDEAVYYFNCARKIQPDNYENLFNLGETYFEAGYTDNAAAVFLKLLTLAGPSAGVFFALGKCYQQESTTQNLDEAARYFQKALSLDPENYLYLYYLGKTSLLGKDPGTALEYFEKMLKFESACHW